jgi:hypothetical protein
MAFAMSAMAAALPARVAGSRRVQQAPRVALPGFVEGGLRRTAGLGASTGAWRPRGSRRTRHGTAAASRGIHARRRRGATLRRPQSGFRLWLWLPDRRADARAPRRTASEGVAALGGVSNGCKWTMMRHGKKIHRLGRPADQRKALLRALTTQLLTHGAIETTKTKAKAVRPWIDKMVNLAKDGSDAKKNQAR